MRSISRGFLIGVGATSVSLSLLVSGAAFFGVRADLVRRQQRHQAEYLDERLANLSRRFGAVADIHAEATRALEARMRRMSPAQVDAVIDRELPLQADGTRRSRLEDFDGRFNAEGDYVHGMGAFVSHGGDLDGLDKSALAAGLHVVGRFGEGIHSAYDNFYFATPHNGLVMYGPDRPDHLDFYRRTAPADLDFSGEEMMRMVSPAADPDHRSRCTSLQHLIQAPQGKRLATACLSPVYVGGRYVGAFGSSMSVADFLVNATRAGTDGAVSLLVRRQGDLLAGPGLTSGESLSPEAVAEYDRRFDLPRLMAQIRASGRDGGTLRSPDGRHVVSYGRMVGPDWYLLLAYPAAALEMSALKSAGWVLGLGLVAAALQTAVILRLARRKIVAPLGVLAASCLAETSSDLRRRRLGERDDEIGILARALSAERDNAQLVLDSLEDRVRERTSELEGADEEKSRFLAKLGHQLRTPLNGVLAASQSLALREDGPEARGLAEVALASGRRLEDVLRAMLDVSRADFGRMSLVSEPFVMAELIDRACEPHRVSAEARGLELTWSVASERRGQFSGDAGRLAQAVSALLDNAVRHTARGWIALRVEAADQGVRLTVTDTGAGMEDTLREAVLKGGAQAKGGLAVCRGLAEALGGSFEVRSRPGFGSIFRLELPLPRVAAVRPAAPAPAPARRAPLEGVRVLLADDHPTNRRVVALVLEPAGAILTAVENGREALDALAAGAFDVVLLDTDMPVMGGAEALAKLRDRERASDAPRLPAVMLVAGDGALGSATPGADHHVAKPIRSAELLAVVTALTGGERADAESRAA